MRCGWCAWRDLRLCESNEIKGKVMRIWRDDPDAESVLRFAEVSWIVKVISLEDIDWDTSALNCARLWNPINEEKVSDYRSAMEVGDVFPRIVVEAGPRGFVILGGNQRSSAFRRIGESELEAYVVKPLLNSQREICIRSLNSRHGWGSGKEERLAHAVYLVLSCGVTTSDAARLQVVSTSAVNENVRAHQAKTRLAAKGIDVTSVPMGVMAEVSKVSDERLAVRLSKIIIEHSPTKDHVANVVKCLVKSTSAATTTKTLNEFESELKSLDNATRPASSSVQRPRRRKFILLLTGLSEFLERGNNGTGFSTLDELQCIDEDSQMIKSLSAKVTIRLNTIARM